MGAPLFSSGKDFVAFMGGSGPMSTILGALGVKPVKFKSGSRINSQVGVGSKMFSIYADGVVPGYRRTTRVRIHAVVDFRSAAEIGDAFSLTAGGTGAAADRTGTQRPGQPPTGGAANNQAAAQATPQQLAAVMAANPAGNVVYWRVE
jgi:general secretion pathway protein K